MESALFVVFRPAVLEHHNAVEGVVAAGVLAEVAGADKLEPIPRPGVGQSGLQLTAGELFSGVGLR